MGPRHEFNLLLRSMRHSPEHVNPISKMNGQIMGLQFRNTELHGNFRLHFGLNLMDLSHFITDKPLPVLVDEMVEAGLELSCFHHIFGVSALPYDYVFGDANVYPTYDSIEEFMMGTHLPFKIGPEVGSEPMRRLSTLDFIRHASNAEASLIADVFETLRRSFFTDYGLDLAAFWSLSSYGQQAHLFREKIELEVVVDPVVGKMVDDGFFAGIIQTTRLKSVANSEGNSNYDRTRQDTEIFYGDISMAYPMPLTGDLPYCQITLLADLEVQAFDFGISCEKGVGYLFCVDLEYESEEVKNFISDLPYPQERRSLRLADVSQMQEKVFKDRDKVFSEGERVLNTLYDKKGGVYYIRFLQWMLSHGVRVTKRHCGVRFREK